MRLDGRVRVNEELEEGARNVGVGEVCAQGLDTPGQALRAGAGGRPNPRVWVLQGLYDTLKALGLDELRAALLAVLAEHPEAEHQALTLPGGGCVIQKAQGQALHSPSVRGSLLELRTALDQPREHMRDVLREGLLAQELNHDGEHRRPECGAFSARAKLGGDVHHTGGRAQAHAGARVPRQLSNVREHAFLPTEPVDARQARQAGGRLVHESLALEPTLGNVDALHLDGHLHTARLVPAGVHLAERAGAVSGQNALHHGRPPAADRQREKPLAWTRSGAAQRRAPDCHAGERAAASLAIHQGAKLIQRCCCAERPGAGRRRGHRGHPSSDRVRVRVRGRQGGRLSVTPCPESAS